MLDKYFNENSILKITLSGEIPEESGENILPFLQDERITILEFYKITNYVKKTKVNALFLTIKSLNIGFARAFEIRSCIKEIRNSGKEVFIFLEDPGNTEFLIASAASKLFIPPWCTFNIIGLTIENYFIKNLLDKLKIEPEIEGFGEFKSAAEMFNRSSMSPQSKEMLTSLLNSQFNNMTKLISDDRNIGLEKLKKHIDESPLKPESAKKYNLVDDICYENEVVELLKQEYGESIKINRINSYKKINRLYEIALRFKLWATGKKQYIGLININGLITQGSSRQGNGYLKTCGSDTITGLISKAAEDKSIKSVIVRVLSPGGSALASDIIRNQLQQLSNKKPVYISMSDVAASGGYMVSLSSNEIYANPFSITGSIGVVAGKFNFGGFLDNIGITRDSLKVGKMASIYSTSKKFSREEKSKFRSLIEDMYIKFVSMVSSYRNIDQKKAEKAAKGRVWSSIDAKKLGLIDHIGTFGDSLDKAQESLNYDTDTLRLIKVFKPQVKISISGLNKLGLLNSDDYRNFMDILNRERMYAVLPNFLDIK